MSDVPGPGSTSSGVGAKRLSSSGPNYRLPCVFRVVRVSGTMRKAEEEAIRRARREILRTRKEHEAGVLEGLVGNPGAPLDRNRKQMDDRDEDSAFAMDVDEEEEDYDEDEDEDD